MNGKGRYKRDIRVFTSPGDGVKGPCRPRLGVKGIVCPTCDARPGEPCSSLSTGTEMATPHKTRARMARRARNEKRTLETTSNLPEEPVESASPGQPGPEHPDQ